MRDVQHCAQSSDAIGSPLVRRHDESWLEDGNIVLIAGETAFRLYRGLLAEQSYVFRDMFASSASTPMVDETFDGLPVVHLSDSPTDVAHLLRVLLPNKKPKLYARNEAFSFEQIFSIVRLAHKYQIGELQEQALELLKHYYAVSFDEWGKYNTGPAKINAIHAIGAVNIARLTYTPSLLPLALHTCCSLGSVVVNGWTRDDGSVEYLNQRDLMRCIDGREKLAHSSINFISSILTPSAGSGCRCKPDNHAAMDKLYREIVPCKFAVKSPLWRVWPQLIKALADDFGVCKECNERMLQRVLEERRKLWIDLPKLFDVEVPGWGSAQGPGAI